MAASREIEITLREFLRELLAICKSSAHVRGGEVQNWPHNSFREVLASRTLPGSNDKGRS